MHKPNCYTNSAVVLYVASCQCFHRDCQESYKVSNTGGIGVFYRVSYLLTFLRTLGRLWGRSGALVKKGGPQR